MHNPCLILSLVALDDNIHGEFLKHIVEAAKETVLRVFNIVRSCSNAVQKGCGYPCPEERQNTQNNSVVTAQCSLPVFFKRQWKC